MFLLEPNETPYDLRWRMFGVSVRVHPMFWLFSAILGWSGWHQGPEYVLIWIACVFVSILVHEFGHVWMGLVFGSHGYIVLYSFGGLAVGSNQSHKRWQRIAVSFAGPMAGFLLLGILLLILFLRDRELFSAYLEIPKLYLGLPVEVWELRRLRQNIGQMELFIIQQMIFINLMWGLLNLLPIWPLDGGQISRDVCEGISRDRGLTWSLSISLVLAGVLTLHSILAINGQPLLPFAFGDEFSAILFGLLALQSFQMLQQAQSQRRWMDEHWDRGDWR